MSAEPDAALAAAVKQFLSDVGWMETGCDEPEAEAFGELRAALAATQQKAGDREALRPAAQRGAAMSDNPTLLAARDLAAGLAGHQWSLSRWSGGGWTWHCACGIHDWGTGAENPSRYVRHPDRDAAARSATEHVTDALLASGVVRELATLPDDALVEAERRGELRALRMCTDLYCQADKDLIRGWANTLAAALGDRPAPTTEGNER